MDDDNNGEAYSILDKNCSKVERDTFCDVLWFSHRFSSHYLLDKV